jgi:propanediol utilization protein
MEIPVIVQKRHVHLSKEHKNELFGDDYEMTPLHDLGHEGQIVYRETVDVIGDEGEIEQVRVLGPCRDETQVELSPTDAFTLGLNVPMRASGDLSRAAICGLRGPDGEIERVSAAIVPIRHLHCSDEVAEKLDVKQHDVVDLAPVGREEATIDNVLVRVHPSFSLEFHLTTDEAAHFWLETGSAVHIINRHE